MTLFQKNVVLIAIVSAVGTGCATERTPVFEEELTSWFGFLSHSYVATAPERRMVIFDFKGAKICAEPPADAADQVASSLSAGIRANVERTGVKAGGSGEFAQAIATTVKQLGRRTQAVQLYRDRTSALCLMLMNGAIGPVDYIKAEERAFTQAVELLKLELIPFYENHPAKFDNPPAPSLPNSGDKTEEQSSAAEKIDGNASVE